MDGNTSEYEVSMFYKMSVFSYKNKEIPLACYYLNGGRKSMFTFRNPVLSLWQSAIHKVEKDQSLKSNTGNSTDYSLMDQFVELVDAYNQDTSLTTKNSLGIDKCAKLVVQIAWAEINRDTQKVTELINEFQKSVCDPKWLEVLKVYLKFKEQRKEIPYICYNNLDDFTITISNKLVIGFIADWGTGAKDAEWLLSQVMSHKPDILIHLGDIYYSGTKDEVKKNFYNIIQKYMSETRVFTLSGNHDMYSGGEGYYWLLKQINQPASYFCLRNDYWQFSALDTGLNDSNPFSISSKVTYLDPKEVKWHLDKFKTAGNRKTILLSHHQLFSAVGLGDDGKGSPIGFNPHLKESFQDVLYQVDLWLWGHEHNLIVFDPYINLQKGRCIGSGAIPMMIEQHPYEPKPLNLQGQHEPPIMNTNKAKLSINSNGFYYHSYAIMSLNDADATITYYQVDSANNGNSQFLYQESIG